MIILPPAHPLPHHHHTTAPAPPAMLCALIRRLNQNPFPKIPFSSAPFLSLLSTTTTTTTKPLTKPQLKTLILSHYANGKFSNLIQNVVASPSVLLTACQNLASLPSQPGQLGPDSATAAGIDLIELGGQLCNDEFEMGFSCFGVSGSKGGILVLPDLRLKIVIEAVRMVLEAVYDAGFVTFAYGGRVGMGRHTAIRYLKNAVENPSWWFSVGFGNVRFDDGNVERLCGLIEERIDDRLLIGLIKRLFECNVLRIELGGCYLGRGLPQECALSPILINVYLNSFDKKIQGIRPRRNQENAKVDDEGEGGGFYKPVKIYAVRYLDEILVITSGSKPLTMDLKNWVVRYLEELDLKVDKLKTVIHSAVWEKIDFLGMELQAVPPSVLRPPMSEKVKRARKKYLRQKEVKALELRKARETNRKKLGMKIFSHVFKKLKKSNDGLKHEYQVEDEVKEMFSTWAKEVMKEYLESLEERPPAHLRRFPVP